ncbi:MAG: thioesterase family protein [Planctomycetota bacterium]
MTISNQPALASHQIRFRVEYFDTDGQRRVHHANYPVYFERGRVEMLRDAGIAYRDLEDQGIFLVVTEMHTKFYESAGFDDLLEQTTELLEVRKVRLIHRYRIRRAGKLIAEGQSTIACVSHEGKPTRLPAALIEMMRSAGIES